MQIEGEGEVEVRHEQAKPIETVPLDQQIQIGSPSDQTAAGLKLFEESVRVAREKLKLALTLCEPGQLLVMVGKDGKESVYFTGGSADRILRMGFSMRWGEKEVHVLTEADGSKTAVATATLFLSTGEEYERFEGRRTMHLVDGEFRGHVKNENNLIKASLQNMKHIAVVDILGMRELTTADLARLGIDVHALPRRVEFEDHTGHDQGGDMLMPFGKQKGLKLKEINDRDLEWYIAAAQKSVADPEKAKWKAKEEKRLAAYLAEKERRAKGPPLAPEDAALVEQFSIRFAEEAQSEATLEKLGAEVAKLGSSTVKAALKPIYESRREEIRRGAPRA